MKHHGTVLVFKPGLTQAEIKEALSSIKEVLASDVRIQSFDDEYGWPVFYIP